MKNDMLQRRRKGEVGGGEGQIDTEVKKQKQKKREQNQVEKLDRTFFFFLSCSFLSQFGVGTELTVNDVWQAQSEKLRRSLCSAGLPLYIWLKG